MKVPIPASFSSNFFISTFIVSLVKLLLITIPKFNSNWKILKLFSPGIIEYKLNSCPFSCVTPISSSFLTLQINSFFSTKQSSKYRYAES